MRADFCRRARPRGDLQREGALVEVLVAVSVAEEDRLAGIGQVAPPPVALAALVDTGASVSAVAASVVRRLGIGPVGAMMVEGYDGAMRRQPVFEVRFISTQGGVAMKLRAIAVDDTDRPIESVIGRDALAQRLLRYDGFHGRFDLAILGP